MLLVWLTSFADFDESGASSDLMNLFEVCKLPYGKDPGLAA